MNGILILAVGANTLYSLVIQLIETKETVKRLINYIKKKCKACKERNNIEKNQGKINNCEDKAKIYALE